MDEKKDKGLQGNEKIEEAILALHYQQFHKKRTGLCEKILRCISPGQHGGSFHHLRLYDAAFFEEELCRQENLRAGNRFFCGGTAKEWPLGNRGLRGRH